MLTKGANESIDLAVEIAELIYGRPHRIVLCAIMMVLSQMVDQHKIPSIKIKKMIDEYLGKISEDEDNPRS